MPKHIEGMSYGDSVICLFRTNEPAERALVELKRLGIHEAEISVAKQGGQKERDAAAGTGVFHMQPRSGLDSVPTLLGLGVDLAQALENMGLSEDTARRYADLVDAGNILLAVRCDGYCERVRSVFDKHGAFEMRTSTVAGASPRLYGYEAGQATASPQPTVETTGEEATAAPKKPIARTESKTKKRATEANELPRVEEESRMRAEEGQEKRAP